MTQHLEKKKDNTNFILRPWAKEDLESLVRNANNFHIAKYMADLFPYPYTKENGKAFIEFAAKENPVRLFVIEIENQAAGSIGIHLQSDIYKKNAELGYWLAEQFWGQGIMTKVVTEVVDFAFRTYNINRIFARPFGTNIASQRVLEKAGFKLEGRFEKTLLKNGEYVDELIYAFRKQQPN